MLLSTRRRLALWYTAVTAVLLLVFASGVYGYVRATLIERVDDTLGHVVEIVERSLVIEAHQGVWQVNPEQSFRNHPDTLEDDHIDLEWFNDRGELIWSTALQVLQVPLLKRTGIQTVFLASGYWLRQYTDPIRVDGQILGYLRVSHPWFEVTKPTQQLLLDLGLGVVVTVGFVGAVGWSLAGLAMQPIGDAYQRLKQFTADASHELRSPLASIQTHVQVALADPHLGEQEQRSWQVIERLTRRLGRLVDDLLFLARQDSGMLPAHPQCCLLDALLWQVVEEQQTLAHQKDISLSLEILDPVAENGWSDQAFTLWGDPDHLARLITNLLDNALTYTPAGGKVTVCLKPSLRSGQTYLQLQVVDTGIGIAASALPRLFDRFFRGDPARSQVTWDPSGHPRGSGLGLAIVKAIVDQYQGQIQVESTPQHGSTFTVTLPQRNLSRCAESGEIS
ncbi:MAG: HAMP domain-containing sensor histidine kinase [Cyanobacteriota bacterium]|nr:HAMP domain-containing sensor histidine kinase [Cyanobacteriota bacterium]